ncbi:MAG: hypothetical protein PHF51_01860 [Candidatus ainarchaeum sp.]|nr:hypothetical protein [Candidatus ainarchaeum sp.]
MRFPGFEVPDKKMAFLLVFSLVSLAAGRLNFSPLLGTENASFTFFQFLAPIGGGIIGPFYGAAAALLAQALNFIAFGGGTDLFSLLRFLPAVFAAWYFGSRSGNALIVPAACMALFWLHPVGAQAPLYALYWLIPIAAKLFSGNLFARSLGATFTAHAVGSVAFIYAIDSAPALWTALIPVVAFERLLFASGIAVSYVAANALLEALSARVDLSFLNLEKRRAPLKAE